jgi:signal transduction histidine kinase
MVGSVEATVVARAGVAEGTSRPARTLALVTLGVAGVGVCVVAMVLAGSGGEGDSIDRALREGLIVGLPLVAGLYAARSPRDARFGYLLIGAAFIYSLTALGQVSESLPYSVGRVAGWLIFPVLYYLMLAFPDGRLAPPDRKLFGSLIALIAVLYVGSALFIETYPPHTPWAACDGDCPPNAFLVLDHEPAAMTGLVQPLREVLSVLLLGAISVSLVQRLRGARWIRRSLMAPVAITGIVATVVLMAFLLSRRSGGGSDVTAALGTVWSLCVPAIAAAFLIGLLQRRLLVASVLRRLSAELRHHADLRRLRGALALALDDPTVELLIAGDRPGRWHDCDGREVPRAELAAPGRTTTVIDDEGTPIAAMVHDSGLRADEELLWAVGSLVAGAVQQERLTLELQSSLGELEDSRHRLAAAADLERSRIERDLHDGAQQRLIKIRIELSLIEDQIVSDPAGAAAAIRAAGDDLEAALDELRSLAHGVYPSLLSDRGLEDALRSVAADSPLPVEFDFAGISRLPREIETAVYFTCVEALQNAIKHADGATRVWITLHQNHALDLAVRDDGPGFDGTERNGGRGLRNMRDRVEAVGGRLTIEAAPGRGTIVRGFVPLGS